MVRNMMCTVRCKVTEDEDQVILQVIGKWL